MNELIKVAMVKGIKANAKEIPTGEHEVDAIVRVRGRIKKGEDFEQVIHLSADPWGLLAVAFSKLNGVTMDAIVKDAMNEENAAMIDDVKIRAKIAIEKAKQEKGKKAMTGKVTTDIYVEEITSVLPTEIVEHPEHEEAE